VTAAPPLPDALLLALDGVLIHDGRPVAGAVESLVRLRAIGRPFCVIEPPGMSTAAAETLLIASGFSVDLEEMVPRDGDDPAAWIRHAARRLVLPAAGTLLVVSDDLDRDLVPARQLGHRILLVRSGRPLDEDRVSLELTPQSVADDFGAWLYRALRIR